MARYISTPVIQTGFRNRCVYSTPGSYTFTVPDGVTSIKAIAVGGGAPGSTGFVDDYTKLSRITEIAWGNRCCSNGYMNMRTCRCVGKGWEAQFCSRVNRKDWPTYVDKYAYAYTGAGGGYAEKTLPVIPGDCFAVTVGDQEETSSFGAEISATGAGAPTAVRATSPCCYGWQNVDQSTLEPVTSGGYTINAGCVDGYRSDACAQNCGCSSACFGYNICSYCMCNCGTYFQWAKTADCPVISLTSSPGCGIGGDVNYKGGDSKTYSAQTLCTVVQCYGQDMWSTCQSAGCISSIGIDCMGATGGGCGCPHMMCDSNAWCYIRKCLVQRVQADSSQWACGINTFDFTSRTLKTSGYFMCCCCYITGYSWPASKTFSPEKQYLSANQGGASAGSPLGDGKTGGIGCTVFGPETDSYSYGLSGFRPNSNCDTIESYFCNDYVFCCEECGWTGSSIYTTCPLVMFTQYEYSMKCLDNSCDMEYELLGVNVGPGNTIFHCSLTNPNATGSTTTSDAGYGVPQRSAPGTCGNSTSRCYYVNGWNYRLSPGCNCLCQCNMTYSLYHCVGCCSCFSNMYLGQVYSPWTYDDCTSAYECCCAESVLQICFYCCCNTTSNQNCVAGKQLDLWKCSFFSNGVCLINRDKHFEDLVREFTYNKPWHWCMWNALKDNICNTDEPCLGQNGPDVWNTTMCMLTAAMWKTSKISHGGSNGGHAYNCHCNCSIPRTFQLSAEDIDYTCYNVRAQYCFSNVDNICCSNYVRTKIISEIDSTDAVVIPGSGAGPNAQGNPGYVLGDNEIYIAGVGADPYGSTEPQYILTSSAASMPKSTYDDIRTRYNGKVYQWYLNECWKNVCDEYAAGGTSSCNACVCTLEDYTTKTVPQRCCIFMTHLFAGCNQCCFGCYDGDFCDYGLKMYSCMYTDLVRRFNLHAENEYVNEGCASCLCIKQKFVIDVGSSGGIVINQRSKNFAGDPLCINTAGDSSVTSVTVFHSDNTSRWCISCRSSCGMFQSYPCGSSYGVSCINNNNACQHHIPCSYCCGQWPLWQFDGDSLCYPVQEITRESGGGSGGVFVNEKYNGSPLKDEYLFTADDPVFGGSGQICVAGSSLYSLPGLTQGGSVGGCIVKGNETQTVTQTPYSGGTYPQGTPGFGGGGTICGQGGTGLVVVYWN